MPAAGILLIILVSLPSLLTAQPDIEWIRILGYDDSDGAYAVCLTEEGRIGVAGTSDQYIGDQESNDVCVAALTLDGDSIFVRTYGGNGYDVATGIVPAGNNGFLVSGFWGGRAFFMKVDSTGGVIWRRIYEDEGACVMRRLIATREGNYLMSGESRANGFAAWLLMIDGEGEIIWSRLYRGDRNHQSGNKVIQTSDGGFILAGGGYTADRQDREATVWKVDSEGDLEWVTTFGTERSDGAIGVAEARDGDYVVGWFSTAIGETEQALLARLSPDGELLWMTNVEGDIIGNVVPKSLDDGFVFAGLKLGREECWMGGLNEGGELIWEIGIEGTSLSGLTDVTETPDHRYLAVGMKDNARGEPTRDNFIIVLTEPDPLVDTEAPLRPLVETHRFGDVPRGSLSVWRLGFVNREYRYGMFLAQETVEGGEVFACEIDTTQRVYPGDTVYVDIGFLPVEQRSYDGVIRFVTGTERHFHTFEVSLTGRGIPPNDAPDSDDRTAPLHFSITEVFPNPFNSVTRITYGLPESADLTLRIYDLTGREVITLVQGQQRAGYYRALWDGKNASGVSVGSGMFFVKMETPKATHVAKMTLVK